MTPHQTNGNGSGVSWRWIVGVLLAAFCAAGGWAWNSTTQQVLKIQEVQIEQGQRITRIETLDAPRKEQLDRIEAKVDSLLTIRGR